MIRIINHSFNIQIPIFRIGTSLVYHQCKHFSTLFYRSGVVASNAPVYTRRSLLVAEGPKPPAHRRSSARCKSRRWRLLVYTGREGHPLAEPPPEGARLPSGSTTIAPWQLVVQCALSIGPIKTECPGHPRTLPLRSSPADRSPSLQPVSFCHKRTSVNV